jgi:hypothetical protein
MNTAPGSIGRGGSVIESGLHTILVVVLIRFNCFLGAEILIVQVQLLTGNRGATTRSGSKLAVITPVIRIG